ncbi:MAG: PQQ-like beta-propeller repeat protein [Spirochaetales bacterium]|nr:PQQ-like beta-propeller repeat protein [Spirochaetales bacterium]
MKRTRTLLHGCIVFFILFASCVDGTAEETNPPTATKPPAASDWPNWRGPAHDGIAHNADFDPTSLKGLDKPLETDNPRLMWRTKVGVGYSGVAVAGPYAYTVGFARRKGSKLGTDSVFCIDDRTGQTVWKYDYPSSAAVYVGPRAFPLVQDGLVYVLSWDGKLFCLDALTGAPVWNVDIQAEYGLIRREEEFGFVSPPVIEGDILIVNAREWGVALDRRTGEKIWDSPKARSGYSPPVLFTHEGRRLLAMLGSAKLYIVDPATGTVVAKTDWRTQLQGNFADPIVLGDTIMVSATYDQGYGMYRFTGESLETLWRRPGLGAQMAAGVVYDGYYYGHDFWYYYHKGEYVCIDLATGKNVWTKKMGMGSVIGINKYLLLVTETGRMIAAEATPEGYREIASCQLGKKRSGEWFTLPTFAYGRLYLRSFSGDCFCLDVKKSRP